MNAEKGQIESEFTNEQETKAISDYYVARSTDRSGNVAQSSEGSFTLALYIHLPIVVRD